MKLLKNMKKHWIEKVKYIVDVMLKLKKNGIMIDHYGSVRSKHYHHHFLHRTENNVDPKAL